jgi:phage shock protein PspC (stress-responsive transcriptional regulator)
MTSSGGEEASRPAARVSRATEGRLLGGVCAGLPGVWGLSANGWRLLFVLAGLFGGIGVVIYAACWLVIPAADQDPDADVTRSVVVVAWATGALVVLTLLAAVSAAATVFGFGWAIVIIAAAIILVAVSKRTKLPPLAALVTVMALTLPAVAVALSPMRLSLQSGVSIATPATATEVDRTVYRSGFGTMLIDLRHTKMPASGVVTLRIHAGLRRTIVALPTESCVRTVVQYDMHTFTGQLAALLSGRSVPPFPDVVLFGRLWGAYVHSNPHGFAASRADVHGPLLKIEFTSQGGGLYVRDYPDRVAPNEKPNWPGFVVTPEPRPNLRGEPKKVAKMMVRWWKNRRQRELASQRYVNSRMQGPCVA